MFMTAARVLLVEDEPLVRTVVAEALSEEGLDVTEACTGDEAAKLLAGPETFDVVLTDVRMPGTLDGVDVAFRARAKDPAMPVVVVSGYTDQMDRLSGLNPPATFIRKPFGLRNLLDVLRRLVMKV